jgi:predicted DNA binding CopG/RHH family protein
MKLLLFLILLIIELARKLAEKRGLKYQTYLKMLLHEALTRESKAS